MKKSLINGGVIILFYSVIIFGVLLLNARMSSLNDNVSNNSITLSEKTN